MTRQFDVVVESDSEGFSSVPSDLEEGRFACRRRALSQPSLAIPGGRVTSKDMYLPDGSKGYNVSGDDIANGMESCYREAGGICGSKGCSIANTRAGTMVTRSLFIKCKE